MEEIRMSEIGAEVESATRAFEAMIGAQLAAGADRCLLAATCIWGGVKEMTEVTSSESAAAALRTIADQIDPFAVLRPRTRGQADHHALIAAAGEHSGGARALRQKATDAIQEMASDVVGDAIDLLDRGYATEARGLLVALRARYCSTTTS
jgi:hypothetical protein